MSIWQNVIVALIVAAALAWLVAHLRRGLSGASGGCSGCPKCSSSPKQPDLLSIDLPHDEARRRA